MTDKKIRRTSRTASMRRRGFSIANLKHIKGVSIVAKAAIYFLLICIGYVYMNPIFEMISKSVMSPEDLVDPSITWVAKNFTLDNFGAAAETLNVKVSLWNSIWISALFALAQTVVSATTGFALSRYKFRGKGIWFGMLIMAFILPVPLLTVPRIIIVQFASQPYNLFGTIIPQFLMSILGQGTYSTILVLIFYNFFNMIPTSLDEAAMIDGASAIKVFYHVAIRLSASTILVVFMFAFVFNWNETYTTNCFLGTATYELLPAKLASFENDLAAGSSAGALNEAYQMAATLISIAPLLVLYALVQRQFIEGIENAGITGE